MKPAIDKAQLKTAVQKQLNRLRLPSPKVYMVDSENMGDIWGALLETLTFRDKLIVFYTKNSPHIAYESTINFLKHRFLRLEWVSCVEGTNALDFQLVTELGARISKDKHSDYIIISKDKGYDAVVDYWQKRGRSIQRTGDVPALPSARKKAKKKKIKSFLPPEVLLEEVSKAVYVEDKALLNIALTHLLSQKAGNQLYQAFKKTAQSDALPLKKLYLTEPDARLKQYLSLMYYGKDCDLDQMLTFYHSVKDAPAADLLPKMKELLGQDKANAFYPIFSSNLVILKRIEGQSVKNEG